MKCKNLTSRIEYVFIRNNKIKKLPKDCYLSEFFYAPSVATTDGTVIIREVELKSKMAQDLFAQSVSQF